MNEMGGMWVEAGGSLFRSTILARTTEKCENTQ
jgi:hypothetical protein